MQKTILRMVSLLNGLGFSGYRQNIDKSRNQLTLPAGSVILHNYGNSCKLLYFVQFNK